MEFKIHPIKVQDILPLTQAQREMLFFHIIDSSSHLYYEQQTYLLSGEIREELIQQTWTHLVHNNEILRSILFWNDIDRPILVIYKEKAFPFQAFDYSNKDNPIGHADLLICNEWGKKINFSKDVFRITLCRLSQRQCLMIFCTHHIFTDGWSNMILLNEFYNTYHRLYFGIPPETKKKISFKKYMQSVNQQTTNKTLDFWKHYLDGYLVSDKFVSEFTKQQSKLLCYKLSKSMVRQINNFIRELKITKAVLFYSAWGLLNFRRKKVHDIIFGITLSGRNSSIPGIVDLVGLFIKTLPLRIQLKNNDTVLQYINRVHNDVIEIEMNQQIRLTEIKANMLFSNINLFDSVIVMQKYRIELDQSEIMKKRFDLELYNSKYESNIDITIGIKDLPNEYMEIEFSYNARDYSHMDMELICENFILIINSWISTKKLGTLEI